MAHNFAQTRYLTQEQWHIPRLVAGLRCCVVLGCPCPSLEKNGTYTQKLSVPKGGPYL